MRLPPAPTFPFAADPAAKRILLNFLNALLRQLNSS